MMWDDQSHYSPVSLWQVCFQQLHVSPLSFLSWSNCLSSHGEVASVFSPGEPGWSSGSFQPRQNGRSDTMWLWVQVIKRVWLPPGPLSGVCPGNPVTYLWGRSYKGRLLWERAGLPAFSQHRPPDMWVNKASHCPAPGLWDLRRWGTEMSCGHCIWSEFLTRWTHEYNKWFTPLNFTQPW